MNCKQQKFYDGTSIIVILIPTRLIEYKSNFIQINLASFSSLTQKMEKTPIN